MQGCDMQFWKVGESSLIVLFLKTPLPSFCIWSKFWSKWKVWSLGAVSAAQLLSHRPQTLSVHCESCWNSTHRGSPEFCARGASPRFMWMRIKEKQTCMLLLLRPHTCSVVPPDLTYKTQVQRHYKELQHSHSRPLPQAAHRPLKPALPRLYSSWYVSP